MQAVWDFENSPLFDDKEKAALRFGFAAGSVPNGVTEAHFTELRKYFSEEEVVELGATVALFGFLNRWNDTFGTPLEEEAIENTILASNGGSYFSQAASGFWLQRTGISPRRSQKGAFAGTCITASAWLS